MGLAFLQKLFFFLGKYLIIKKVEGNSEKNTFSVKKFAFFIEGIQMARNSFLWLSIDHLLQENYF